MPLDAATRTLLWRLHGRKPPPDRRQRWLALALVVLLHGLFVLLIWHEMRPPIVSSVVHLRLDQPMRLRFVASAPAATVRPVPAVRPPPAPSPPAPVIRVHEPAAADAMTVQLPAPRPVRVLRLYDRDGQPLLPAQAASAPEPGSPALAGDTRIMRHSDPVKYRATRFEQYFPPPDETLGGAAVRHVVEAVVKSTAVDLPRGIHLKCTTVLGIPIPNCINPPAPPSAKDGDERLSMAPARPLATDPHAPAPPGAEACIAMYRAGRPLAPGCPVDTPERSVDAELRTRRAGAVQHP
ncbi:MAG: hypothetical protein KGJ32_08990 [Xanthomonadaceae bacterium]|nr:hypothetical protein [Xanthomonadaceae bacterium]